MKKSQYETLMEGCVTLLRDTDDEHTEYYIGYIKGLHHRYEDEFGTNEQHDIWNNIPYAMLPSDDPDIIKRLRRHGYRDGLAGEKPMIWIAKEGEEANIDE
ncbi:hypothetical protein K8R14_02180 [bacterium]|nr:hypothetical protein [bacterium]